MVMLLENHDDIREQIGRKASTVAIAGNIFLTIFNFAVGTLSGSSALIAESAHTLSDVLTSIIAFVGFKIGMKPADKDHQYGHGRAEPLVGLVIVVFLVIVAYEILSGVYIKLTSGNPLVAPDLIAAVMALVGIITNIVLTKYLLNAGEKIQSPAIIADGQHQKVDIFSCIAILVGVLGSQLGYTFLDPLVAIIIALIVIKTAIQVGIDNVNTLMGKLPSNEIIEEIEKTSMKISGVEGVHGIRINPMGPYCSAVIHIELSGELSLKEAHFIAHNVEHEILANVSLIKIATVHVCPHEEECDTENLL